MGSGLYKNQKLMFDDAFFTADPKKSAKPLLVVRKQLNVAYIQL